MRPHVRPREGLLVFDPRRFHHRAASRVPADDEEPGNADGHVRPRPNPPKEEEKMNVNEGGKTDSLNWPTPRTPNPMISFPLNLEGNVTIFSPHMALKLIAWGKLTLMKVP